MSSSKGTKKRKRDTFKGSKSESVHDESRKEDNLFVGDRATLERALAHLQIQKRIKKNGTLVRGSCKKENSNGARTDHQIRLRCRQLPNVVLELRKSIMRQNWDEAATLLLILCHPGYKLYNSLILKTLFLLLLSHPKSNKELFVNFIRCITGYILDEDIKKFIKILFIMRKMDTGHSRNGRFVKGSYYKVTRDVEFENI